ncbi:hypothetical protein F183_A52130 [Bryobacterales bacterium F-183]|nr:hypothetical protein F183_A52130 [Bryobacterales bacterium F-183]
MLQPNPHLAPIEHLAALYAAQAPSRTRVLRVAPNARDTDNSRDLNKVRAGGRLDLSSVPDGSLDRFDLVLDAERYNALEYDRDWLVSCIREGSRMLSVGGLFLMKIGAHYLAPQELVDLTRRYQLQALVHTGPGPVGASGLLWRRREMNWREQLGVLAGITAIDVRKVTNALRTLPVAPSRGRFASIAVWVQGLPDEVDIFDLEIRLGGACAGVQSISPSDSRDIRQIVAQMPELEQTGLLPVEAFWMGERMGKPGTLRVIPPPPEVPRMVSVTRHSDGSISALIDELANPDHFSARIDGKPAWGYENRCVDATLRRYEIRFQMPDGVVPGTHLMAVTLGRRELPPLEIQVANPEYAGV